MESQLAKHAKSSANSIEFIFTCKSLQTCKYQLQCALAALSHWWPPRRILTHAFRSPQMLPTVEVLELQNKATRPRMLSDIATSSNLALARHVCVQSCGRCSKSHTTTCCYVQNLLFRASHQRQVGNPSEARSSPRFLTSAEYIKTIS